MDKNKKIFGIDISKNTFDVMDCSGNYYQFDNNTKGFVKFLKLLSNDSHCVMEATGYYPVSYTHLSQLHTQSVLQPNHIF